MNRRVEARVTGRTGARRSAGALSAALMCLLGSQAADAAEARTKFEITPFIGQMAGGEFEDPTDNSDRDVADDSNFGVFFNINAGSRERQYEFLYTQQGTEIEGAQPFDMDIQYLHLGGIVNFTDANHVVPYFGMTVGATRFSPDASGLDEETKLSFTAGGGVKVPITDHIGVRFDARAFVTLLDSDSDIFCVSAPEEGSGCAIRAKSDTFLQYAASLGVIIAF